MDSEVRSWDLVEHLFDASVSPERLDELIAVWDAQIASVDPERSGAAGGFRRLGCSRARSPACCRSSSSCTPPSSRRVNDLLSTILGAAMVLADDGAVLAANDAAAAVFGLRARRLDPRHAARRGRSRRARARVAQVAAEAHRPRGDRPAAPRRARPGGARAPQGDARRHGRRQVLAVTSELAWPEAVSEFLARVFALTAAEVEVMRRLVAGETVAAIAAATGRSAGTVRSQLHAILQKTATRSQAEVVRLGLLLMQSVPAEAEPRRPPRAPPSRTSAS